MSQGLNFLHLWKEDKIPPPPNPPPASHGSWQELLQVIVLTIKYRLCPPETLHNHKDYFDHCPHLPKNVKSAWLAEWLCEWGQGHKFEGGGTFTWPITGHLQLTKKHKHQLKEIIRKPSGLQMWVSGVRTVTTQQKCKKRARRTRRLPWPKNSTPLTLA